MPLVMVRLEWVRSAEPPTVSSVAALITPSAISEALRVATLVAFSTCSLRKALERFEDGRRQLAGDRGLEGRALRRCREPLLPGAPRRAAARGDFAPGRDDLARHLEGRDAASRCFRARRRSRPRPAARRASFPNPAGWARPCRSSCGRRSATAGRSAARPRSPRRRLPCRGRRPDDMPAGGREARRLVHRRRERGRAVDGNRIVVPEARSGGRASDGRQGRSPHG